ncbi:hypothetical protein DFQ26_004779 [Actinomortierella ambigua]|nr:hypothetical protein DFQ26_004779 [Actinomortierella ambigua]
MTLRAPEDRRVTFSVTMRSESTKALNVILQRLMDTIGVYHRPRQKSAKPQQQGLGLSANSTPAAAGTTTTRTDQDLQDTSSTEVVQHQQHQQQQQQQPSVTNNHKAKRKNKTKNKNKKNSNSSDKSEEKNDTSSDKSEEKNDTSSDKSNEKDGNNSEKDGNSSDKVQEHQTPRPPRNPNVTLGGIRGPIRLPKAGRVHSRTVYLIQVSERALRQIAAESAVPLHDQVGEVETSQELDGAVEVIFDLE